MKLKKIDDTFENLDLVFPPGISKLQISRRKLLLEVKSCELIFTDWIFSDTYCKLVRSKHLLFYVTTNVYFVLHFWCPLSLASLLHSVGCEFPHPSKIDRFTCLTETDRPGLNFIKVLRTAFKLADPKSVKRYWWLNCIFLRSWDLRAQKLLVEGFWNWHRMMSLSLQYT